MSVVVVPLLAYLVGSVPFGYLVARARGVDIFQAGSGNIGATNVGRVLGRRFGVLVFLLDVAKGAVPVAIAQGLPGDEWPAGLLPVLAGLAAFLGHLFPIWLGFRGGKGVATGAGVVAVLLPVPALGALLAWLAAALAFRIVSLASLLAALTLCILRLTLTPQPFAADQALVTWFTVLAGVLVLVRHRANLARLYQGTENRIQETPTMMLLTKVVHVLALGLWFGGVVLFTFVVGLTVFRTFEELSGRPGEQRPFWLPVPPALEQARPSESFPDPLRKEQGSRLAGAVVAPIFPQYFMLQLLCGVLALATAWALARTEPGSVAKARVLVIGLALLTVLAGWWLARKVQDLREVRNQTSDAVLLSASPTPEQIRAADDARADFGRWHTFSLLASFATLILVTIGMAMAASLPEARASEAPPTAAGP